MKWLYILILFSNLLFSTELILNNTIQQPISKELFITEVTQNNKGIQEVMVEKSWQRNENNRHSLGFNDKAHWIKLSFQKKDSLNYILHYNTFLTNNVEIYLTSKQKVLKQYQFGFSAGYNLKQLNALPLHLKNNTLYTLYLKVHSNVYPLAFPIKIVEQTQYNEEKLVKELAQNIFFLLLALIIIYNVILYIVTQYKYFKPYLLYLSCLFLLTFSNDGYLSTYIINTPLNEHFVFLIYSIRLILIYALIVLVSQFINMKRKLPKIYATVYIFFFILLIMAVLKFALISFINTMYLSLIIQSLVAVCALLLSGAIFYEAYKKNIDAIILSFAWVPLLALFSFYLINQIYYLFDEQSLSYVNRTIITIEAFVISILLIYKGKQTQKKHDYLLMQNKQQEHLLNKKSKFFAIGEMLNHIAHEWKKPLGRINSLVFNLYFHLNNKDAIANEKLDLIEKETAQMSQVISNFMGYFDSEKKQEPMSILQMVHRQKEAFEEKAKEHNINIQIMSKEQNVTTLGYKKGYERVISVILDNAVDIFNFYKVQNPSIQFVINVIDDLTILSIENNGPQIQKDELEKLFDPYYTTQYHTKSTGIGLYLSKMLIEESMQKKLTVENTEFGVRFNIEG